MSRLLQLPIGSIITVFLVWNASQVLAFTTLRQQQRLSLSRNEKGPTTITSSSTATTTTTKGRSAMATALQAAIRFKNFESVLETFHERPLIVHFSTKQCGPCKLMSKELETVRKMVGDDMEIFSVDTEKWPQLGSRYEISALPCLLVFRDGEVRLKMEGVNKAESVVEQVRTIL